MQDQVPAYQAGGRDQAPSSTAEDDRLSRHQQQHQDLRRPPRAGLPPSSTPTNAPGSVTRPTVRLGPSPASTLHGRSERPPRRPASGLVIPIVARPASSEAKCPSSSSKARRPGQRRRGHHVADHQYRRSDIPRHRRRAPRPRRRSRPSTGTIRRRSPVPTHGSCERGVRIRPVDVTVATANISSTNASDNQTSASVPGGDHQRDERESVTARRPAVTYSRSVPRRPRTAAATARTSSAHEDDRQTPSPERRPVSAPAARPSTTSSSRPGCGCRPSRSDG